MNTTAYIISNGGFYELKLFFLIICVYLINAKLLIRGGVEDDSKINTKIHVLKPHRNCLDQTVIMRGHNIYFYGKKIWKIKLKLFQLPVPLLIWSTAQSPLA